MATKPKKIDGVVDPNLDEPLAEPPPEPQPDPIEERLTALQQKLDNVARENELLRRGANLRDKAPPPPPEPEPFNFEEEFYKDPNGAMAAFAEGIRKTVETDLTTRYRQEQSQQQFWAQFYRENPDLEDDKDLVTLTLNSNVNKLADLPVAEASKQLADLTRDRILRYTGKEPPKTPKAQAEGGNPPTPKPQKEEVRKVTSLSDLIRRRKELRRTKAQGA